MKKIFILLTIIAAFSMLANNATATTFDGVTKNSTTASTTIGGASFKVSTGVTLVATVCGTANTGYSVASKHVSGNKSYGATAVKPSVVETDGPAVGTATPNTVTCE